MQSQKTAEERTTCLWVYDGGGGGVLEVVEV